MGSRATVSIAPCASYGPEMLNAVRQALSLLPDEALPVCGGRRVLIKPNLLTARRPEEAVTTHPALVRALIRLVREWGGLPCVADSPANAVSVQKVWDSTGFRAMCHEESVPLLNLEKAGSECCTVGRYSFTVAKPVLEADVIINVPKVKTHVLTTLTGAVKNMYGVVPGFQKTGLHKAFPSRRGFGELLAAIYSRIPPHLSVADGVLGMEGPGPAGGVPRRMGFLAASTDGVALDRVLCGILGINPVEVPVFRPLARMGIGTSDLSRIEVAGLPIAEIAPECFRAPGPLRSRLIPVGLVRLLDPFLWIRPAFTESCVSCGLCARACPVNALQVEEGRRPQLDTSKCIGCCCCHEICPHRAVRMRHSLLLWLARGGKGND